MTESRLPPAIFRTIGDTYPGSMETLGDLLRSRVLYFGFALILIAP
jgi:hypothetical protein